MSASWLCKHLPRAKANLRLFCFPHAGVGSSVYRLWPNVLPANIEVCPVQLPGRENRLNEAPMTSIPSLVDALVPALLPHMDLPFVFFGHSMGAVVATEVVRALHDSGYAMPKHLLISGRRPPHIPSAHAPFHALSDADFVAEINRRYRGIPQELMQQPDLLALLLPCLRADITALETHLPPRRSPLPCAISAFGGKDDALTPREHLEAWRTETTGAFRIHVYPGDHFYLGTQRLLLLADIAETLAPLSNTTTMWSARA